MCYMKIPLGTKNSKEEQKITKFKNIFIILALIMIIGNTGCKFQSNDNLKVKDVRSISLECIQLCLERKSKPFSEKVFEDRKSIGLFVDAVNEAEKMQGILNYGAIFLMTLRMNDGSNKEYHFNIENTEESQKGLIIKLPNTEQGYTISEKTSKRLKELIYKP